MEGNQLNIPEGWEQSKLIDTSKLVMGQSPDSKFYNSENGTKFLQGCADFGVVTPIVSVYSTIVKKIAPKNSILFSVRAPVGKINFADDDYCIGRGLAAIIPLKLDVDFLFQYIKYYSSNIGFISQGSTFDSINSDTLGNLKITYPKGITEQTAIANILSKTDQAIANTEALIAKYTQIKTGLMQDLLTKGIDENGNIRTELTHEFKDSPLGRIPKEWTSEKLSKYGFFAKGYSIAKSNLSDNGVSCVLYGEIYTKYNFYSDNFYSKVPYEIVKDKTPLEYGDILFAGSGETHKDIGKCIAFVGSELTYAGGDIIIFRTNKFNPIFLSYFLNSFIVEKQKAALGQGSSVIHIYPDHLKQLMVVHFDIEEQNKIVEIIKNADKHISTLEKELSKLLSIKTGLMQDLLSGKVRVNNLKKVKQN